MSLQIQADRIVGVLLADGWHDVVRGTFDIDSYEFADGEGMIHEGGESGVCSAGFSFTEGYTTVCRGPLTSILAVRLRVPKKAGAK